MATADSRRRRRADDMRPHYDIRSLQGAVRGKYAARYAAGPHVVRLAPDVATAFPSDTAVNNALRRCLCDSAGRPVRGVSADQLLLVLLDDRAKSVVATLERASLPLTMAQIRRKIPGSAVRTLRLILEHCEAEGHIRRVRLRGVDRWSPSEK
jgi:hypothetical protein